MTAHMTAPPDTDPPGTDNFTRTTCASVTRTSNMPHAHNAHGLHPHSHGSPGKRPGVEGSGPPSGNGLGAPCFAGGAKRTQCAPSTQSAPSTPNTQSAHGAQTTQSA